jgi:uncharacterized protein (TIGR00661 family)
MKILYGVSGEGFGHSSRAKELILFLNKKGHKIKVLTYGRALETLKEFNPKPIHGLGLAFKGSKLAIRQTIKKNLPILIKNIRGWSALNREIKLFKPDICITDFEPITARLAYANHLPLISIDNEQLIAKTNIEIPKNYQKEYILTKATTLSFVPKATFYIIFSPTPQKSKENIFFAEPIVREEIRKLKPKKGKHLLVYLSKKNNELVANLLKLKETCIIYSEGIASLSKHKNLVFKPFGSSFINDLKKAKAVIGSAGLSLISECIYLKKPYFAVPIKRHIEQLINAKYIQQAGFGQCSENPSAQELVNFLSNLQTFEKNLKKHRPNPYEAEILLGHLLTKCKKY